MDGPAAVVGAQLRAVREAAGVSLAALAAQIPYSKSALFYYETGQRTQTPDVIAWYERRFGAIQDPVATLLNLGRADVERRSFLRVGYSTAISASVLLPGWLDRAASVAPNNETGIRHVGQADVAAVRDVMVLFSQIDQRLGGGHGRTAVVQYLTNEVTSYLKGAFASDAVRNEMFSAAGELAYLAGWMAFDNDEHAAAQRYFATSTKLSAEANDAPLTGELEQACTTWTSALAVMDGVQSGRTRNVARDIRATVAP